MVVCLGRQMPLGAACAMMLVLGMILGAGIAMKVTTTPLGAKNNAGLVFVNDANQSLFVDVYVMNGGDYDKLESVPLDLGATKNVSIAWRGNDKNVTVFAHYTDPAGNELDLERYIVERNQWYMVILA